MYNELIEYIAKVFLMHKAVKSCKYQDRVLINVQYSNPYAQVVIESSGAYAQWLKTANVFTLTLNINILGLPNDDFKICDIQSDCFQIGNEALAYIDNDPEYKNIISIYDYDFLSLDHYTDDNACGWRLSLELIIPNPVNLCINNDNFSEDNIPVEAENPLDIINSKPDTKSNELVLNPIRLPKNKR